MKREDWNLIKNEIELKMEFKKVAWPTVLIFMLDLVLIYSSWQLSHISIYGYLISLPILTFSLLQLYLILHEATHSAVAENKTFNNFVGHVCGILTCLPFLPRQTSHLLHHTWTGHPVRDPANQRMIKKFSVITSEQIRFLEFVWKYWIPLIVLNDRIGLWKAPMNGSYLNGAVTPRILQERKMNYFYMAFYLVVFLALLVNQSFIHFIVLWVPAFVGALFFEELVNLPHHAETPLLKPTDKALPYWEQHLVTHSCESVPIWSKYVLLYFNYHVAHHYFPSAPWYRLKKLDQIIRYDLQDEQVIQNEFSWSLQNRKRRLLSIMGHYFDQTSVNHSELYQIGSPKSLTENVNL